MVLLFVVKLTLGAGLGLGLGWIARRAFLRLDSRDSRHLPGGLDRDRGHRLRADRDPRGLRACSPSTSRRSTLGTGELPGRRTAATFHQGLGWVAQIALFFMLGLLVFPGDLGDLATEGLLLSAVLIVIARPAAAVAATLFSPFDLRERLMLGWAGLRGATPIWLATFPVVAGVAAGERLFDLVFFVVLTSTLIQGASFEPLARRLRLTTTEPALPRRLHESGRIRELGGDVIVHRVAAGRGDRRSHGQGASASPRGAGQRDRPRRQGDPPARLDRDQGRRRAPRARPRRAARRGRGADRALARGPDRRGRPAAARAAGRAPDLHRPPGPRPARPRRPARGRRDRGLAPACAAGATALAPLSPWSTAATR